MERRKCKIVEYAKTYIRQVGLLQYNYLRMHERPNSVVVSYDLLSLTILTFFHIKIVIVWRWGESIWISFSNYFIIYFK